MRTSVFSSKQALSCRGFTLIEIMLVLLIIGITVGMISSLVSDNPASIIDREARRLQALITEASNEAISQGIEITLAIDNRSDAGDVEYQLLALDQEEREWRSLIDEDEALRPVRGKIWNAYSAAEDVTFQLTVDGMQLNDEALAAAAAIKAFRTPGQLVPSILMLSSGELTPFTLVLSHPETEYRAAVISDGLSGVYLQ